MKRNLMLAHPWFPCFDDVPPPAPPIDPPPPVVKPPQTFTQDQLNKFLADDRRKHQEQIKTTVTQLEELKKTAQMSDQQRLELETRIETLNSSLMTTEERSKADLAKKDKELQGVSQVLTKERDTWKTQYASEVITNKILKAASEHKAVSADQMLDLLMPKTRLVEVLDTDGKTVKGYIPKAKIKTVNDKGEEIELDLTIEETMKRLKEMPERYGNLFDGGVKGGLGGAGSTNAGGTSGANLTDLAKQGADAYRANRAKFGLGRRKSS